MALGENRVTALSRSTAEGACALRAAGTHVGGPEYRNPDYLAERFIAPGLKATALAKVPLVRRLLPAIFERMLPGGVWYENGRTRWMDEVLLADVAAGATQVVILGAGLDSRAYRLENELAATRVFEVDHPATAAIKRERLEAIFGGPPARVEYVEVDFNRERIADRLAEHGFDPGARTFVVWSGVAPYLEPEGVEATLEWFAAGTGPGSAICFDYLWQEMLDGDDSGFGARELRARVEASGEPFKWGIPRGETAEFAARFGLEVEQDLGPEAARERLPPGVRTWDFGGFALLRKR